MCRVASAFIIVVAALMVPLSAVHATIVVSEVAWMGSTENANAEWIELQNTGTESVSLSGWTLTSSTGAPSITLVGTISGAGFYLLERTSDASVSSVLADQIYSGALSNSGATLTLKDGIETVHDTVVGGTNWASIGGDNTTKHTPQRTGDTWATAEPTPRSTNASSVANTTAVATTTSTSDPQIPQPSIAGVTLVSGVRANPVPALYIEAGSGKIVARGALVPFRAYAYDSSGEVRRDSTYTWSFGDGGGAEGTEVTHTYSVAGTYTIGIHAKAGPSEAVSTLSVRVHEPVVSVIASDERSITLKNNGAGMIDLSAWYLEKGENRFMLPPYTVLLSGQEAHFPSQITGLGSSTISTASLLLPDGTKVSEFSQATTTAMQAHGEPVTTQEEVSVVQPVSFETGIHRVEAALPQIDTNALDIYEETRAPSTLENPSVLGASVGSSIPTVLKSPWTISFLGLLVAAGTILAIL